MVRASLSIEGGRPESIRERRGEKTEKKRTDIEREMSMEVSLKISMWLADV